MRRRASSGKVRCERQTAGQAGVVRVEQRAAAAGRDAVRRVASQRRYRGCVEKTRDPERESSGSRRRPRSGCLARLPALDQIMKMIDIVDVLLVTVGIYVAQNRHAAFPRALPRDS
jgi:hypothetical protein